MPASSVLPITQIRPGFLEALEEGSAVVSAPTGSGKSTEVPRWCPGPVLVVEPRRVACRSLARRVAELEGTRLGEGVGYHVRDEKRCGEATRILFATPGIVLRIFREISRFKTVILDEFHERSLDVDLLLALLRRLPRRSTEASPSLVVMSATLAGERIASYLGGRHLGAEGRVFPVEVRHLPGGALLPDVRGLEGRVSEALEAAREQTGDVLVFLPGKGEIRSCAKALRNAAGARRSAPPETVLELHGGLSLEEQNRVFEPARGRKVILATNVAETSITLPGITAVIDSGLVRRTRYHRGRGFLTLGPIALDSADQRTGRAGRTGPGLAIRLWREAAQLDRRTPPEIHRESLVPLVLGAAACGARFEELEFLDPPKEHAIETACGELRALGALDEESLLTECGRELFGLPIDPPLGRLLVEAKGRRDKTPELLDDMIDLVAALAVDRPLLTDPAVEEEDDDGREISHFCDAARLIRALRGSTVRGENDPRRPEALREARAVRRRLRRAYGLAEEGAAATDVDRRRLALAVLAADPRAAHVARRRGRRRAFSNGGTELELGRASAVARADESAVPAIVVLETRALGAGGRDTKTLVTSAMPVPLAWLLEAGLGRDRLAEIRAEEGCVIARVERVYARRILRELEEVPRGALARQAIRDLFLRGSIFRPSLEATRERLRLASLARRIVADSGGEVVWAEEITSRFPAEVPPVEEWVDSRLTSLGVESGEDLALLSATDLLAPDLPAWVRAELDRTYPRSLEVLGAAYEIDYDLQRREAVLRQTRGRRHQIPPIFALPHLPGFAIKIEHRGTLRELRAKP